MPPKVRFQYRHQYDEATDEAIGDAAATRDTEPSMTQQSFKDDVDINVMMHRMGVTDGALPPVALHPNFFGDFSDVPDFREALDRTHQANERFAALPADLRKRFGNDPVELYAFVTDPSNHEEAVRLGLLHKAAAPAKPAAPAHDTPGT